MTTRELLMKEINRAPEDELQVMLRYIQTELRRNKESQTRSHIATGPYSDYWNQFIGTFTGEDWDRPNQGELEKREEW